MSGEIFRTCPDRPWGPPSLLYYGYRVFPGGKERPGRDADPSPPSSAVGHERVELYLYSPYGLYGLYRASVPVQGCTLPFSPRFLENLWAPGLHIYQTFTTISTKCEQINVLLLVNNHNALLMQNSFSYTLIPVLYMFRAPLCPSSGESIVSIRHLVYVTVYRRPSGVQVWMGLQSHPKLHTRRSPT